VSVEKESRRRRSSISEHQGRDGNTSTIFTHCQRRCG